jgi:hypothetical protein
MKRLEKFDLINRIGRELQSRMTYVEIDSYFQSFNINTDHTPSRNSKWVWVKEILANVSDDLVLEIASELEIPHAFNNNFNVHSEDATFWKPGHFKLFISHISSFKKTVSILKNELEKYGVSAFVAHEDIEPTKEWQNEIEKGLFSMDALCACLMPGFKESNWTDQEIGVAIGRGVLVIPIRKGLDPYGFIGKFQGFQSQDKKIREVAEAIFHILTVNPNTRSKIIGILVELFLLSNSHPEGLQRIRLITRIRSFPREMVDQLSQRVVENKNLQDTEILKEFNFLMSTYGISNITLKDFETEKPTYSKNLPF